MSAKSESTRIKPLTVAGRAPMALDETALEAARRSPHDAAVTPNYGPWRGDVINLLNDSLATELVCVLRYKRHHFTA
jgi:bacterioferritin